MASVSARKESGLHFIDFRYGWERCREQTLLTDTPANRKRLEKVLAKIEADVAAGAFDYGRTFPNSRRTKAATQHDEAAAEPGGSQVPKGTVPATPSTTSRTTPTLAVFAEQWLRDHEVEWRRSHIKVLRSTVEKHLVPALGVRPVESITKSDILGLRTSLAELPGRAGRPSLSNKRINGILAPL